MDKIFAPIKGRIYEYLDKQRIKRDIFYKNTGISPSNFKGKGAISEIGGDKIAKILTTYPSINPDWLLTGQGDMLRSEGNGIVSEPQSLQQSEVITLLKEQLKEKEVELKELYQEIGQLKLKTKELEDKVRGLDLSGSSSSHTRAHSQDVTSVTVPSKK